MGMRSPLHGYFIAGLVDACMKEKSTCGDEYKNIMLVQSSCVLLRGKMTNWQPDLQFLHTEGCGPRVVVEVALAESHGKSESPSQSRTEKNLGALATMYIEESHGEIGRVFGIRLDPLGSSTVSEWYAVLTPSNDARYGMDVRVAKRRCRVRGPCFGYQNHTKSKKG